VPCWGINKHPVACIHRSGVQVTRQEKRRQAIRDGLSGVRHGGQAYSAKRLVHTPGLRAPKRGHTAVFHAALVQQLLGRFLGSLWGNSVLLFIARNLQRRLTGDELAFLWLQGQRIFARMPATFFSAHRVETYP